MDPERFLHGITLERILPCMADPEKVIAVGAPSNPLDDVLPFLAHLPNVITYNPGTLALVMRRRPGFITIEPRRVSITQVADSSEAVSLLGALADAINATWAHRHELTAVHAPRRSPRPLDLWGSLPRHNCGECGEPTCLAFAVALIQGTRQAEECPPLFADAEWRSRVQVLLGPS
jgi:ArsR family metal-binding transcriptional regulator